MPTANVKAVDTDDNCSLSVTVSKCLLLFIASWPSSAWQYWKFQLKLNIRSNHKTKPEKNTCTRWSFKHSVCVTWSRDWMCIFWNVFSHKRSSNTKKWNIKKLWDNIKDWYGHTSRSQLHGAYEITKKQEHHISEQTQMNWREKDLIYKKTFKFNLKEINHRKRKKAEI